MFRQVMKSLLAGTLLAAIAIAPAADASERAARLNGVLVSPNSAIALIDGQMYREGDAIGEARIVAIAEGSIRVLSASGEFDVRVGSRLGTLGLSKPERRPSMRIAYSQPRPKPARQDEPRPLVAATKSSSPVHRVESGETLSEIAIRYREDGVTLDQMMIGLFRVNPAAFDGNIHKLYSGAALRIPVVSELAMDAVAASAEVRRQTSDLDDGTHPAPAERLADSGRPALYGPVETGETLSTIASRIAPNDVSNDQMMMAIFESNPEAFGENINLLYAGATLRIPDRAAIRLSAESASSEVFRHVQAWRHQDSDPPRHESTYAGLSDPGGVIVQP